MNVKGLMKQATNYLLLAKQPQVSPPPLAAGGGRYFNPDSLDEVMQLLSTVQDPDAVLLKLGRTRADLRGMEGDDEITQALDTRREAVLSTPWRLEAGDDEIAMWVSDQITPHYAAIVSSAWSAVPYGYSVMRPIYSRPVPGEPGAIGGLSDIQELEFENFTRRTGGGWERRHPTSGIVSPVTEQEEDYLYFFTVRRSTARNPYGEALLSRAYWPWFYRHNGWRFWMQFLERFGSPLLLGKTSGDPAQMVDQLVTAVQDAVVAVGSDDEVKAVAVPGTGEAFDKADKALVERIQRLILGQTASSGDAAGFSQGQMQENVRKDKRDADLRLVAPTVQCLINALVTLRFGDTDEGPRFVMEDGKGVQTDRATRDATLTNAGILKPTEDYLLRVYDYEVGDFEIPTTTEGQSTSLSLRERLSAALKLAGGNGKAQRFTPDQDDVEALAAASIADTVSPIRAEKIARVIGDSEGPEDLAERLGALFEEEPPEAFQDLVERSLFAADVLGYVNAKTGRGT